MKINCRQLFSEYKKNLGKNTRLNLFNYRHKLESQGELQIKRVEKKSELNAAFEYLNLLHHSRWNAPCFDTDALAFHKKFANKMLDKNCLEFSLIELDGTVISALYNFIISGREYNIQAGFKNKCCQRISIGSLHMGYAIERAFQSKNCDTFDLLAGKGMKTDYKKQYKGICTHFQTVLLIRKPLLKILYACYGFAPSWLKRVLYNYQKQN
ncbi:MAG: GNAT family N-acetyltransferase [Gammaproteobacteria bacterium]|nr:GNAT family N-acetyltransferase [Gammaproteobacteria bacterium]